MSTVHPFTLPVPCRPAPGALSPSYIAIETSISIGPELIESLMNEARRTGRNVRFCLHPDVTTGLQEMIIVQHAAQYFPPKQHPQKAKSFHILAGELAVFTFNSSGDTTSAHRLAPGATFLQRVGPGIYHTDIPLTSLAVHLETTTGPFQRESDRLMAPWAPAQDNTEACLLYRERLLTQLHQSTGGIACTSS